MTFPGGFDMGANFELSVAMAACAVGSIGAALFWLMMLVDGLLFEVRRQWGVGGMWERETRAHADDHAADNDLSPVHAGWNAAETIDRTSGEITEFATGTRITVMCGQLPCAVPTSDQHLWRRIATVPYGRGGDA
ncbi:hypothetical protein [Sphingomonas montanisoli]|uniref:Uncharacterized protein n=1 Tax=Sphingomonas montanisoli TaxID=2606412 RepID=A0A5D9C919_9SPHN|nr:hypothetical protein [Sphingomonas montanisoli]TZG26485.1 hypothetical protein FYJ91_16305 [Sphingomonas montanisoli]